MSDRDWLVPGIALTALSGIVAMALIPSYAGIMPAIGILPYWMIVAAVIGSIYGFFAMVAARVDNPVGRIREAVFVDWRTFGILIFGIFLAGLNMTTFMWTKPLLNHLIPFWADPLLADIDSWLFLGNDPWIFLTGLNTSAMAIFYHRGWVAMMLLTLIIVLAAPPSPRKSAILVTYFLLWSVLGPVIHILLPATGPIFYAEMGYGNRFAGLSAVSETREMADYLWPMYENRAFGAGAGISAMPSLHISTTVWMMIAIYAFARRLFIPMALAGLLVFLLSVALGWHYAVDGIAGGVAAWLCYRVLHAFFRSNMSANRQPAMAVG